MKVFLNEGEEMSDRMLARSLLERTASCPLMRNSCQDSNLIAFNSYTVTERLEYLFSEEKKGEIDVQLLYEACLSCKYVK